MDYNDYEDSEEFEDSEEKYIDILDYEKFCIEVLRHSAIDADLVLAGFKSDEEKLPLMEEALKLPYDPKEDLEIVPMFELKSIIEEFVEHGEDDETFIKFENLMECCKKVAQRILWATFELASKHGFCEPVVEKDGTLNYVLKTDI